MSPSEVRHRFFAIVDRTNLGGSGGGNAHPDFLWNPTSKLTGAAYESGMFFRLGTFHQSGICPANGGGAYACCVAQAVADGYSPKGAAGICALGWLVVTIFD